MEGLLIQGAITWTASQRGYAMHFFSIKNAEIKKGLDALKLYPCFYSWQQLVTFVLHGIFLF